MKNLKLLKVYTSQSCRGSECTLEKEECKVHFSQNFKFHSDDLRYLFWHGYSLKSLPCEFNPENLVELNMPYNHIKQLWKGEKGIYEYYLFMVFMIICKVDIENLLI